VDTSRGIVATGYVPLLDASFATDEEKKRVLQMLFSEIRADHTENGLTIEFKAKPIWEPYSRGSPGSSGAARRRPADCYHFGAEDGGQTRGSDNSSARAGRARMAPVSELVS